MTTDRSVPNTPAPYQDDDEIDLTDLLFALWKQKWIIILCAALFVAGGIAVALMLPKTYEAQTSLLILPPIPAEITGSGTDTKEAGLSPTAYGVFAPDIYKELAVAHDLLQEVINLAYPEGEDRPTPQKLAAGLKVGVNKSSEEKGAARQSLTLTVTLRGGEPEELSRLLTAWSNSFIKKNSLLFVNRLAQSYDYLKETFSTVQKDLVAAEDALFTYRKENPTSVLSFQLETMKTLHGEFLTQYTKNLRSLAPLEARAQAIREFLSSEPERISLSRGMTKDSVWAFLSQRLGARELEQLKELNITDELLNQHHQTLKAKLYELDADIADLKAAIADLRQHIENAEKEYTEKQARLLEISLKTERFSREEKVLQESYDTLAKKFQTSRIAAAEAADPIRVIEQPVLPTAPVAPRKTLIVALSGVLGVFIGLFAALIVNMIQNRREVSA